MDKATLAKWLDLPADPWPPDHFRLLGLEPGAGDPVDIEQRAFERMERLRPYQLKYPDEVTEGMNLLAQAMVQLCDPGHRALHESSLGLQPLPKQPTEPPVPPAPPEDLPVGKLVRERRPAGPLSPPIPLAKLVREIEPEPEPARLRGKLDPGQLAESLPSDPKRLAARKRSFNRRLVRQLRRFEHLLATPLRKRQAERDTRTLKEIGQSLQEMGTNPFWWALRLEDRGDRLLSIGKMLMRFPSLDYLMSTLQQDIGRDLTKTLLQLESEYRDDHELRLRLRSERRRRYRYLRIIRETFQKPERLLKFIAAATMAVALFRWMTGR